MKTLKFKIIATSLAAIAFTSFVVQGREEELCFLPNNTMMVSVDCFGNFLQNLKKIKAIIYIPDSKISRGNELNLFRVQPGSQTLNLGNYIRVEPVVKRGDECSSQVKVDFDNLNMIVYVEKSRLAELQGLNLGKIEGKFDVLFPKREISGQEKVFPKLGDKMFLKHEGKFTDFSPVEFKFNR
jgi:hypothetical protein